ncbi:hypothetical protein L905_19015 [Agrobacterium sp. TS43]|nr:hypothetical protein L903_19365 [Agrobacterium sp. JL28]KVK49719.1 hypothetical protein L904_19355 [Agrobacterium sp. LY4]KVK62662.1 hypothetical protein L906_18490 [Agrobacterium sp. TS45]KVK65047.1 hypothetical protein L905_19015 [Agrobacterium sp. TS43]KVK67112.1 hypothetical protein L907_18465 [Agrobacterium sp. C13]
MVIAILNNLPDLILGFCWSSVLFYAGLRFERWKAK